MPGACSGSPGSICPCICIPAATGFIFVCFHRPQEENSFEEASFQARIHAKSPYSCAHFRNSVGASARWLLSGPAKRKMGFEHRRRHAEISIRQRPGSIRKAKRAQLAETRSRIERSRRVGPQARAARHEQVSSFISFIHCASPRAAIHQLGRQFAAGCQRRFRVNCRKTPAALVPHPLQLFCSGRSTCRIPCCQTKLGV